MPTSSDSPPPSAADDIRRVNERADDIEDKLPKLKKAFGQAKLMLDLVRDYAKGEYKEVPVWAITAAAVALLYVLNPVDVIPDVLIGVGFLDDAAVIAFCLKLVQTELDRYVEWRSSRSEPDRSSDGPVIDV